MKKGPILSFLAGFSIVFLMALTTDQIMQKVYDSSNTALRVNQVAGGGSASSITSGTTTITSGADTSVCFDDAGVINCGNAGIVFFKSYGGLTTTGQISTGSAFDASVQSAAVDIQMFAVPSSGGNSSMDSLPQTVVLGDYSSPTDNGMVLVSSGPIRLAAGGFSTSKEFWNITTAGVLASIQTGLSINFLEGSAPSGASSHDIIYGDSTAHRLAMTNNNGTAINVAGFITGTASITPGTITASQCADSGTTITVTGAGTNDPCMLGPPAAGAGTHISATCYISGASTATVRFCNSNTSNQTGTTGTYRATVVH